MESITITKEIDARGSFCPGPLMELIRNVKMAQIGDVIAVISSTVSFQKTPRILGHFSWTASTRSCAGSLRRALTYIG